MKGVLVEKYFGAVNVAITPFQSGLVKLGVWILKCLWAYKCLYDFFGYDKLFDA